MDNARVLYLSSRAARSAASHRRNIIHAKIDSYNSEEQLLSLFLPLVAAPELYSVSGAEFMLTQIYAETDPFVIHASSRAEGSGMQRCPSLSPVSGLKFE